MHTRLELILTRLARQHVPHLVNQRVDDDRLRKLASGLAKNGILVLVCEPATQSREDREQVLNAWISAYGNLYILLTETLFPTFTRLSAFDADKDDPPVVVIEGNCSPVIQAFAEAVVPYVAVRRTNRGVTDHELMGVMSVVLEDLEAGDLHPASYEALRREGALWLRHLLQQPLKQYALTVFKDAAFAALGDPPLPPTDTPSAMETMPPPPPELNTSPSRQSETTDTALDDDPPAADDDDGTAEQPTGEAPHESVSRTLFQSSVPIFFKTRRESDESGGGRRKMPPVPPPLSADDDADHG